MPKNTKKAKNSKSKSNGDTSKRIMEFKADSEQYARVEKLLGDRRVSVILPDNSTILARIAGRLRKQRITIGDIVLISFRSFQDDKSDLIHVYSKHEVAQLILQEEIPADFIALEKVIEDDGLVFIDEDDKNTQNINIDDI
jgi:initiation factor 1A